MLDKLYQQFSKSGASVYLREGICGEYINYRCTYVGKDYNFEIRHIQVDNKDYLDIIEPARYNPFTSVRIDLRLLIGKDGDYKFLPDLVVDLFNKVSSLPEKECPAINRLFYKNYGDTTKPETLRWKQPIIIYQIDPVGEGYVYRESVIIKCVVDIYYSIEDINQIWKKIIIIRFIPGSREFTFEICNYLSCKGDLSEIPFLMNWDLPLSNWKISKNLVELIYKTTINDGIRFVKDDTLINLYNNYYGDKKEPIE